jgi:hypothetical protein
VNLATLQTDLPTLLGALMGITCQFATQPRAVVSGASAVVDLLGSHGLGVDDREIENIDDAGDVTTVDADAVAVRETVHGLREMTMQVTAWSASQKLDESSRFYLERLRTRLRWTSTVTALRALGLSIVTIEAVVPGDTEQGGRLRSQASLDVHLGYGASETDASIPFIERARIKSESISNAAGAALPASMQVDINPPE